MMPSPSLLSAADVHALVTGRHRDPFRVLGPHESGAGLVVRAVRPGATRVTVVRHPGGAATEMARVHDGGLFEALVEGELATFDYRLQVTEASCQ